MACLVPRCPEKLAKNGGSITLSTKSARNILKSLVWVERSISTAKKKMSQALYPELTFSWKKKIAQIILEHDILEKIILNFEQTAIACTSPNKITYTDVGSESVLITIVDVSVFFHLGKKCKFEISENQFFCPKIVIFAFYGIKLRTKTGLVSL